jgi:hypothetical protein
MDASIVHDMVRKCFALQNALSNLDQRTRQGGVEFSLVTNHDNFSVGKVLFPFLPYLLRDCYINLYQYDYLQTIRSNVSGSPFQKERYASIQALCKKEGSDEYLSGNFDNPHFIKFG